MYKCGKSSKPNILKRNGRLKPEIFWCIIIYQSSPNSTCHHIFPNAILRCSYFFMCLLKLLTSRYGRCWYFPPTSVNHRLEWLHLTAGFQRGATWPNTPPAMASEPRWPGIEMWGAHRTITAWEMMPPGCQKCMSQPCIIPGAEMDTEARPRVPLSVRCLDRTTNQTRLGRLAAHLISVLSLLGTFSSQWAISRPNDERQIHLSSAARYKTLCKVEYPPPEITPFKLLYSLPTLLSTEPLQSEEVHSLAQFIWKEKPVFKVTKDNGFQLENRRLGKKKKTTKQYEHVKA